MAKAGVLLIGTDDGIVLFSDPGGTGRWLRVGRELRGQVVSAVWLDYATPLLALALIEGRGLWRSEDGGRTWRSVLEQPVVALAGGDRHAPSRAFALLSDGALLSSQDSGASWQPAGSSAAPAPAGPPQLSLVGAERLLLSQANGIWASPDQGAHWTQQLATASAPQGLAALPDQPDSWYALVEGQLHGVTDGSAWVAEQAPPGQAPLAALPGKTPTLLLASATGIQRSDDHGASWQPTAIDQPWSGSISVIAPARYNPDVAIASSRAGTLALSTDRGRTWQTLRSDLAPAHSISAARLA